MGFICCEPLEPRRLLSATPVFFDNFEGDVSGWRVGTTGSVTWGLVRTGFGGQTARSGNYMVYAAGQATSAGSGTGYQGTSSNPGFPSGTHVIMEHSADLTGDYGAFLSFWYDAPAGDDGQLSISVDNEQSPLQTIAATSAGTAGWAQGLLNISQFVGSSHEIQFAYTGTSGQGVYIDDVEVYTDKPGESIAPTAKSLTTISDIDASGIAPISFSIEYDDDTAIELASIGNMNISVLLDGNFDGYASLQSTQTNSAKSIVSTYTFAPTSGQWDGSANGAYSIEVTASNVFDTSGNAVPSTVLASFNCAIPIPVDTDISFEAEQDSAGAPGAALPQIQFGVQNNAGISSLDYSADIYIANAPTISANNPGELVGELSFDTDSAFKQITLDPSTAGLTIPMDLSPGTYSIGVHVFGDQTKFPDPDDANNWLVTGKVTVSAVADNPIVVTVMVLYTQQAAAALGGDPAIQKQISASVATTNTVMLNSNIDVQLQLVYAGGIDYAETADPVTDLGRLSTAGDGYLDQAQVLRNSYLADLVCLWTATTDTGVIGEGYVAGSADDQDLGYSVVVATQMDQYTFAHELGHNFGAGHAPGDSSGDNSDQGLYDYSYGYRFSDPSDAYGQLHDVMAYPPGQTIPYYSSPDIDYLGSSIGTADADNARTIREDAANVAAYRTRLPAVTVAASAPVPNASEAGPVPGSFRVTATIASPIIWPTTVNIPLIVTGSPSGSDYQPLPASVSVTIPPGATSAFSDIAVTPVDDSVYEDNQTVSLVLGAGASYTVNSAPAIIRIEDAASPRIASITAPSNLTRKATGQLVADGVAPGDAGGKLKVTFYRDSDGNGNWSAADAILGTDKNSRGGWTTKMKAKSLPVGNNLLFAVATDSAGRSSAAVSCTLNVINQPPTITKFTARVSRTGLIELNAAAKDSDGKVTQLMVWFDSNSNGMFDPGEQDFTAAHSLHLILTGYLGATYRVLAVAHDNDGAASVIRQLQITDD